MSSEQLYLNIGNEDPQEDGYSSEEVTKVAEISKRQLDNWTRKKLISASIDSANGSGTSRRYSYLDLLEVKLVKVLIDSSGMSLDKIKKAFDYIRKDLQGVVANSSLVISGDEILFINDKQDLVSLVGKSTSLAKGNKPGQCRLNMNIFDLPVMKEEVDQGLERIGKIPFPLP